MLGNAMRGTAVLTLAAAMLMISTQADARGGHHGRGHHGHARFGVFIGAPLLLSPWWASSYYYPPAPVVVRERVVVREPLVYYDERGNPVPPGQTQPQVQAQAQPQTQPQPESTTPTWFYCADSQTYYPYVQSCATPWQRVAPHSPPPPR
jgi:hypothetical protein